MSNMIMINRAQSVKSGRGCYTFIHSCIGVPAELIPEDGEQAECYHVQGIDIVRAYQLIAEPLGRLDAMHCERDGPWSFHPSEVIVID